MATGNANASTERHTTCFALYHQPGNSQRRTQQKRNCKKAEIWSWKIGKKLQIGNKVLIRNRGLTGVGCNVGWIQFQNKCYWFSHDSRSWGEAEGLCYVFHSKLAEPLTDAESHFLISHSQVYPSSFWIGISDMIEEDRWIYSSNQNVIQVNGWFPGEPNGHTGENCVALEKSAHGKWIDVDCKRAYKFVCEADVKEIDGIDVIG
uniref:C-type lectin domain-containing protein n=1 Tax=Magallana gigas TaxID=29159 RepID=A0A8W8NAK2_MAGGI